MVLTVETTNTVDVDNVGDYVVTYRAMDAAGNYNDGSCEGSQSYERRVKVVDTLKPVIGLHVNGRLIRHGAGGVSDEISGGVSNPAEELYANMLAQNAALMTEQGTSTQGSAWATAGIVAVVAGVALLAIFERR
jgi:hypothetical protein